MQKGNKHIESNKNTLTSEAFDLLIGSYNVPAGKGKEKNWNEIFEIIDLQEGARVVSLARTFLKIAAIAIVFIGIGTYAFLFGYGNIEVAVPKGEQISHFLPDSSEVIINADSKLVYNKNRLFIQRDVNLSGEALFKVKKGSRFQVKTTTATTSVLGTIFNVYARKGLTKVSCVEGKVLVKALESNKEVLLTKGLETKTMGYAMEQTGYTSSNNHKVAWTNGDFYFDNSPISNVIEEIERQFDVDVFMDGDTNRFYTGYFNNKNLSDALELVCIPMNLDWKSNGNMIILKENRK